MTDLAFEALCEVWGVDWQHEITDDQRGRVNAALKQLRSIYPDDLALPMMIHERAAAWAVVYPGIPLTPQALTTNWSTILNAAAAQREREQERGRERRRVTNAQARSGCSTCGDDHVVIVGQDANGHDLTAPCPDCNPHANTKHWVERRPVEAMDPTKTRETLGPDHVDPF